MAQSDASRIDTTFYFVSSLDPKLVALNTRGVKILMKQVPEKAKERWGKLKKQKEAELVNNYMVNHLNNYQKMLKDTNESAKLNFGYVSQAFLAHMSEHELRSFERVKRVLSGEEGTYNKKTNSLNKDVSELQKRYGKYYDGNQKEWLWRIVGKESARRGWTHFIMAHGNLSGLPWGDIKNLQVKAGYGETQISSWKQILKAITLLENIVLTEFRENSDYINFAREILTGNVSIYGTLFGQKLVYNSVNTLTKWAGENLSEVLKMIRTEGIDGKSSSQALMGLN